MAKRIAVLAMAWTVLLTGVAGADEIPLWPCEVTVSIEPGPWYRTAVGAVRQLDNATKASWIVTEADAMVTIQWGPTESGGDAWMAGTESEMVEAVVTLDDTTPNRWVMTGLLHELGHVGGIDHNDEERSVMNASDVPWRKYQPVDLDALDDVGCL